MTLLLTPACSLQGHDLLEPRALGGSCSGLTNLQGAGEVQVLTKHAFALQAWKKSRDDVTVSMLAHGNRAQHARAGPARAAGVQ